MPIPPYLPPIEPVIPDGYVFVAITRADPNEPVAIMGWPTKRRDSPDGPEYLYPVTDDAVRRRCQQENLNMVRWRIVPYHEIPKDRTYRDAWEDVAGAVAHNMTKARNIHRDHIRLQRSVKMMGTDVEYQRADELNDPQEKKRVAEKKQALRNMPADPTIEAAQSIAQLKAFWPDDLM